MNTKISLSRNSTAACKSRNYSKINAILLLFLISAIVFVTGCKKDDFDGEVVGVCPVVATDPTDKAIDVALDKVISATFNTSMNVASINNATFIIKHGSTVIPGTISTSANGTVFSFTPTNTTSAPQLLPFEDYTGTITTGAIDTFRTAMVDNYEWTFKTIPQVKVTSTVGGSATPTFTAAQSSSVTVTATPAANFVFRGWTVNGVPATIVSPSPSYTFTMDGNRELVANFEAVPVGFFAVNISSNPSAGGMSTGADSYPVGSNVTVSASPNAGYAFINWTDNGVQASTSSSYQFILTGNRTLVANYSIIPASQFSIALSSNPTVGGGATGSGSFPANDSRTVTAAPITGYTFTNWTENGNEISTSASYTFNLTANRTLVANFRLIPYTLTVTAVNGSVTKNPNPNPGLPTSTHNYGSNVTLEATPNAGYRFTGWSGSGTSGIINPLTVNINEDKNITANFTLIPVNVIPPLFTSLFGAFGGTAGMTNQGIYTVINNGNIGTTGASTTITGFHDMTGDKYIETGLNIGNVKDGRIYTDGPPPVIFAAGGPYGGNATTKAIADAALLKATAFYNSISPANRPGGTVQTQELGGLTLPAGTYKAASDVFQITNGDLTLDGRGDENAVWVFQANSSLTVGDALPSNVKLIGNAQAKNVYWYVGSSAVINYAGGGVMVGTIISRAGATMSSPANSTNTLVQTVLNGRIISLTASVTMVNSIINNPED